MPDKTVLASLAGKMAREAAAEIAPHDDLAAHVAAGTLSPDLAVREARRRVAAGDTGAGLTAAGRLRALAARTASQCWAAELAAIALAEDTFGDREMNALATTLAGASHRLGQIAERIAERTTPTTQEDTDDKPDLHPHLAGPAGF